MRETMSSKANDGQADLWWRSEPQEVAPAVHRIPLPLPDGEGLRAVNVYVIEADSGLTLVDAGWATDASRVALERGLSRLGHCLDHVERFLVTHVHPDHYTQAVAVRREYATQVVLGEGELPALKRLLDPGWDAISPSALQLEAAGAKELVQELRSIGYGQSHERDAYALPDQTIGDGDEVEIEAGRLLVAMHTPGHTRGHMVFVDHRAGLIFAGDHVLPHITPSIGFEADPGEMPLGDYLNSLARVRSLPDLALLPAHGPVTQSVHARVDEIIDHHRERLDLCVNALVSGAETGYDVARRLPWTRRGTPFDQLDAFNRMLATTETLAHLRLLRSQGRLALNIESGVERFVPSAYAQEN